MIENDKSSSLAAVLQLSSPALPIGSYAYSTGLEYAVEARWIRNAKEVEAWISELAVHNLCNLDLPVLRHLYRSWQTQNADQLRTWSQFLLASRESMEMLQEDQHLGIALARLLSELEIASAKDWIDSKEINLAVMFSLAASQWNINESDMQTGYLWSWCEQQVSAAIKLVPIGQTAGQRILLKFGWKIPAMINQSLSVADEDIGQSSPALAIASALHEQQYSRLFRS